MKAFALVRPNTDLAKCFRRRYCALTINRTTLADAARIAKWGICILIACTNGSALKAFPDINIYYIHLTYKFNDHIYLYLMLTMILIPINCAMSIICTGWTYVIIAIGFVGCLITVSIWNAFNTFPFVNMTYLNLA